MQSVPDDKTIKVENRKTRAQGIEDRGGTPLFPPVYEVEYLIGYWHSIGLVGSNGMGMMPLSAIEINEWQKGSCINLSPWEFMTIRAMSTAYITQYHEASKTDCQPPYGQPEMIFNRTVVSNKMQTALKTLMAAK
jgi:hypothetical protein